MRGGVSWISAILVLLLLECEQCIAESQCLSQLEQYFHNVGVGYGKALFQATGTDLNDYGLPDLCRNHEGRYGLLRLKFSELPSEVALGVCVPWICE